MSLTAQTLQAIQTAVRDVVREEVMFEVGGLEQRLSDEIRSAEKRLEKKIDSKVDASEKRLSEKISSSTSRLQILFEDKAETPHVSEGKWT